MSRVLEFRQSPSPEPGYEVAGRVWWNEGMGGAYVLVREVLIRDDAPCGIESGTKSDG